MGHEARVEHTRFPKDSVSPLRLYQAIYSSHVQEMVQENMFGPPEKIAYVTSICNLYPGSIMRRNTEYMEAYFCGPLTSAGAIRIPNNPGIPFKQNAAVAETFRDALIPQLVAESAGLDVHLTVPSHVGVRSHVREGLGWGEGDYNFFWLMYLSGIDPASAQRFAAKDSTMNAIANINRKDRKRDEYKIIYQNLVDDFIAFATNTDGSVRLNKMAKMVTLPDSRCSFGSQMEMRLAHGLGIPVEEAHVNPEWIKQQQHLWFVAHKDEQLNKLDEQDFVLPTDTLAENISLHTI